MTNKESLLNVNIIIATRKRLGFATDAMYLPLQVGAALSTNGDIGYAGDDTGENISYLNGRFCELTGLYWAWKNLSADYIGLVHYRRLFAMKSNDGYRNASMISYDDISPFLGKIRVFVPEKRRYYIETLYSHYKHTHYAEQLEETGRIIEEKCPEYSGFFNKVINRRWGYMFNMFIMDRDLLDEYCSWLFDILFELKDRIGEEEENKLSPYQRRLYGRISEIIFNVWLEKKLRCGELNKDEVMELPVIMIGKVNWIHKIKSFLLAKYAGIKYETSF